MDWAKGPDPAELWEQMPAPAVAEALGTLLDVRDEEREVTTTMLECKPDGVRMHGLEFRMKSPASLARKIAAKAKTKRLAPAEAAASITDLVRYTAVSAKHDDLVPTARTMVDALSAQGFTVHEAEHSYVPGNPYKGLHLLVTCPPRSGIDQESPRQGMVVELQIHSEQSQRVKDSIHGDYELERDLHADWSQRAAARARMEAAASVLPAPPGLDDLDTLGGVTVMIKQYPNIYESEEVTR
ncbi:MAG: hypothetical protein AAGC63_16090 [Propionicimonas sp.]